MKKFALGIVAVGLFIVGLCLLGMLYAGCGSVKPVLEEHQDEVDQFEKCAVKCGAATAVDMLACPLNGGGWEQLINSQVASGLAKDTGVCILGCMSDATINVVRDVCGK